MWKIGRRTFSVVDGSSWGNGPFAQRCPQKFVCSQVAGCGSLSVQIPQQAGQVLLLDQEPSGICVGFPCDSFIYTFSLLQLLPCLLSRIKVEGILVILIEALEDDFTNHKYSVSCIAATFSV